MLTVGIPKECKPYEKRVGLVPESVQNLTRIDGKVFVEKDAGQSSGFSDQDYLAAGACILPDAFAVYQKADLIVKVKEPQAAEFPLMRQGQIIFCFLHLASPENCDLVAALTASGATAIGFETLEKDGKLPILAPMSVIAGALSAIYGAVISSGPAERSSLADEIAQAAQVYPELGGLPRPGRVLIYGGGVAGQSALETAHALQASGIAVIEKNPERRLVLKKWTSQVFSPEELPLDVLESADILIGSVHARGERALRVIDESLWKKLGLTKNKIVMDISIDQGGNFPESHSTTYANPVYRDSAGHIHFGVPNIPSLSGSAASRALSKEVFPYVQAIMAHGADALREYPELGKAVNVSGGKICVEAVKNAHLK